MLKRASDDRRRRRPDRDDDLAAWSQTGHPLGHAAGRHRRPQGDGRAGRPCSTRRCRSTASRCCRPPAPSPRSRASPPRSSTASTARTSPTTSLRPTPAASRASRRASSACRSSRSGRTRSRSASRSMSRNKDKIKKWGDLTGKRVFTGPLPFDTRAQTERAPGALGVKFTYVQVDLATVGSQLESGAIDAMTSTPARESSPPPWLAEASLAADWAALNPSADEIAELKKKGFADRRGEPEGVQPRHPRRQGDRAAVLLRLQRRSRCAGGGRLQDAEDHREERRRTGQDRSDLLADRQGHEGLPEARRGIVGRSRADPSRPRQMDAREGRVGREVGFQDRQECSGCDRHDRGRGGRHRAPVRRFSRRRQA